MGIAVGRLRIERVGLAHPDALTLIEAVQEEYIVRYGGRDETPLDPSMFEPPVGAFFVGYLGDVPSVSGAWRRRSDVPTLGCSETAEIKRMYVASAARRAGHARAMLAHLEETAAAAGAEAMILETGTQQPEALELYSSAGYQLVEKFGFYCHAPESRCFARRL